MKVLILETPTQYLWLNAKQIAEHRANYYADIGEYERGDAAYNEEVDHAINDDYEAADWLQNNMDYEDWADFIVKTEPKSQNKELEILSTRMGEL